VKLEFREGGDVAGINPVTGPVVINRYDGLRPSEKLLQPVSFEPCSAGTSLDSFQFAKPLTL
jgi:hypothetical protein